MMTASKGAHKYISKLMWPFPEAFWEKRQQILPQSLPPSLDGIYFSILENNIFELYTCSHQARGAGSRRRWRANKFSDLFWIIFLSDWNPPLNKTYGMYLCLGNMSKKQSLYGYYIVDRQTFIVKVRTQPSFCNWKLLELEKFHKRALILIE